MKTDPLLVVISIRLGFSEPWEAIEKEGIDLLWRKGKWVILEPTGIPELILDEEPRQLLYFSHVKMLAKAIHLKPCSLFPQVFLFGSFKQNCLN